MAVFSFGGSLCADSKKEAGSARLVQILQDVAAFVAPASGTSGQAIELKMEFEKATGSVKFLEDHPLMLRFQAPNRLFLAMDVNGPVSLSTDGTKVWLHVPAKNMLIEADNSVPRFSTRPDSIKTVTIPELKLPVTGAQLAMVPLLFNMDVKGSEAEGWTAKISPKPEAVQSLKIPAATLTAVLPDAKGWPQTLSYDDGKGNAVTLKLTSHKVSDSLPQSAWQPQSDSDDKVERVALAHIVKFAETAIGSIGSKIPSLPPATGSVKVTATEGRGRLEDHDGANVLYLAGSPEEMGRQHGTLMKKEIRYGLNRILYGVGVGSSFDKGRWFFGEIEEAVRRSGPFVVPEHLREMDAIAEAAGMDREEVRLSNFFPELFHCSGFALMGSATKDGRIFHGRILDYLRGAGLEENAVLIISKPDYGHGWANVSYAGFTGSVTAMNEKQVSLGEMGGRGEGNWDGKPMAQLVREIMEKADDIDEAIDIMRRSKRTCEYYYVIADGKTKRACGIKATPEIFEVIWSGESHPQLSDPVKDTVLLSADDRYKELVKRVKNGFGRFDTESARDLMTRPVCMDSNIQSVLFAPDTLDFWVANADGENVASATRYSQYNLRDLLSSISK